AFMFASEIKCFLDHPKFKRELNKDILGPYLTFSFTPTTETFFKGVYRLNPGHSLTYRKGEIEIEKYYDIEFNEIKRDYEDAVNKIEETMKDSVKHHLESDVEIGSFLSSGIDSSYIVSLAHPDKTYTVGYDIPEYSEISYAEDLASRLKIKNISKKINKEEYMKIVPKVMYHMDEPFCDAASIALYFLSELAAKDVKVVLSGEGADEFFAGYNTYKETVDMSFYNKIPYFLRHAVAVVLNCLPEFRGRNFLVRRGTKLEDEYISMNRVFSDAECRKVLGHKSPIKNKDITKETFEKYKDKNDLIKMQAIDINFWLVKDILHKADRMTMANSLELRVPFIDKEVFALASSLEQDKKVTKINTKIALREAASRVIPNESYKKKKLGFPVPLRKWMSEEDVQEEIRTTFEQEFVKDLFDQKYILKLLDDSLKAKKLTYKKVWAIYT
ncbi:MAG: asparagine synthase (glutamine-hydrolyzing), partial [Bacilli bacterium]|nr:asparagine synthase (glutamine-hydrolyzing) [Bacilli bacterium]